MIVEVRGYRITPGRRDEFIRFFEQRAVPAQRTGGTLDFTPAPN